MKTIQSPCLFRITADNLHQPGGDVALLFVSEQENTQNVLAFVQMLSSVYVGEKMF